MRPNTKSQHENGAGSRAPKKGYRRPFTSGSRTFGHPAAGAGLTEILMASALGLVIIGGVMTTMKSTLRSTSKADSSLEQTAIKTKILNSVSCQKTIATPCADGAYIALKDSRGKDIIPSTGAQVGKFLILARCVNTPVSAGIDVRMARLSPLGQKTPAARRFEAQNKAWFLNDEMDVNLPYSWDHPKSNVLASPGGVPSILYSSTEVQPMPAGGIIMWSGSIASIPAGWALCDGTNETPNLRDRFIVGTGLSSGPERAIQHAPRTGATRLKSP